MAKSRLNQKYFPATQIIYVDKNRADVYTPDGSFDRPFLTIMEAVNTIALIGASEYYTIEIANGIYDENIVLENTGLKYLKIQGNGYVNINPATDNSLQSLTDNDNLFALHLDNLTFSKPVKIKGANGTGMLQDTIWNEINFIDSATLEASCVNNISMKSCYSDQDMTFENVPYIHMESTQNQWDLTLIGDSFVNAPSWGVAMQVHPYGTYESGNVSYTINGTATMEIVPNGCRRWRGDVTVPAGVTIYAHNSYLRGEVTNKWVIYLRNSFIQEYVDGGGTLDITKNPGSQVDYDNTWTWLSSDNVQDAITELDAITESILTISNEIFINPTASEIPGIRHQSFASAFAWIATNSPSSYNNRRVVKFNWYITENLTGANAIPRYVAIIGIGNRCCGILGSVDFLERGDDRLPQTNIVMDCMISDLALTNLPWAIGKGICLLNVKVVNCSSTWTWHYMYANGCSLEWDFIAFDGTSGTSAKTNIINSSFESWSYLTRIPKAEWVITSCQFWTGWSPQLIIGWSGNWTAIKDSFFEAWWTIIFEGTITLEDCDFITWSADVQIITWSYIRANNTIFRSNVVVNTGWTLESVDMIIVWAYDVIEAGGIWTNKWASYNHSTSWLSSTNVQSAIDELAWMANNQITDITYAWLQALKTAGTLIPWRKYKISDFASKMFIGNTNNVELTTWDIEELVVLATSKNTISNEVKSMQYPQDDIWYDIDYTDILSYWYWYIEQWYSDWWYTINVTWANTFTVASPSPLVIDADNFNVYWEDDDGNDFYRYFEDNTERSVDDLGGNVYNVTLINYTGDLTNVLTWPNGDGYIEFDSSYISDYAKWKIYHRKDNDKNIEMNFDFRTAKSRIYALDVAWKDRDIGTAYTLNTWVLYNNYIYICILNNTWQAPSITSKYRVPVAYYTAHTPFLTWWVYYWAWLYQPDTSEYRDVPVLANAAYTYDDSNVKNYKNFIDIDQNAWYFTVISDSEDIWPSVQNTEILMTSAQWSVMYGCIALQDTKISKLINSTLTGSITFDNYWNVSNSILAWWSNNNINKINQASLYVCNDMTINDIQNLTAGMLSDINVWYFNGVFIGNYTWASNKLKISYASSLRVLYATNWNVTYINGCTLWKSSELLVTGVFYQNNQDLTLPNIDWIWEYTWTVYGNRGYNSISWKYRDRINNKWRGILSNNTIRDWSLNYLEWQIMNNNIWKLYKVWTNTQHFLPNMSYNIIESMLSCTWTWAWCVISKNTFGRVEYFNLWIWEITNNNIQYIYNSSMWANGLVNGTLINNILNSIVSVTINEEFSGNTWWSIENTDFNSAKNNTIVGKLIWWSLTTATHIAADYSTIITANDDAWYNIAWTNSATWYNYDAVTA